MLTKLMKHVSLSIFCHNGQRWTKDRKEMMGCFTDFQQNLSRIMLSQRASVLKKKGVSANGQFQNMHLAVFPYEIQFLKDVDGKTAFYFQKMIGRIQQLIPASSKGHKYPFKSFDNIIHFRLFSQNNVVYQWSAYSVNENGEEAYRDSCAINLKEIVTNFIIPQKSSASRSTDSMITLSFGNQEVKLKFPKLGVILSILLLISDDPKSFKEVIQKKYYTDNQQNVPQGMFLKTDSTSGIMPLSSRKHNSEEEKKEPLVSSIKFLKNESKEKDSAFRARSARQDVSDLDNLILSEDKPKESVESVSHNEFNELKLQLQSQKEEQSKMQNRMTIKITEQPKRQFASKQQQIENDISSGILKLQSDQIGQEKEDIKLELEQLEMIEEEIRSGKQTAHDITVSPRFQSKKSIAKNTPTTPKNQNSLQPIPQQQNEPRFTLKKAIVYFIILLVICVGGGVAIKSMKGRRKAKRK